MVPPAYNPDARLRCFPLLPGNSFQRGGRAMFLLDRTTGPLSAISTHNNPLLWPFELGTSQTRLSLLSSRPHLFAAMDAAGTFIGALSLGLTLCQGIVSYCQSWKHQDDEVKSLIALAQGLIQLLLEIQQRITSNPALDPGITAKLDAILQACSGHCDAVLQLSTSYAPGQSTASPSWRHRTKELAKRLKFPIEKKVLGELKDIMLAFRGNVDTALGLLNLDLSASTHNSIQLLRSQQSKDTAAVIQEIQSIGSGLSSSIDLRLNNNVQYITAATSDLSSKIPEAIKADMSQMLSTLELSLVAKVTEQIESARRSERSDLEAPVCQHRMLEPPQRATTKQKRRGRKDWRNLRGCQCDPNVGEVSSPPSWLWPIGNTNKAFIIHRRSCPLWYRSQIITEVGINVGVISRSVRALGSIKIRTFPYSSIPFRWSISPNITFKAVVPYSAPAFRVVQEYFSTPRFQNLEEGSMESYSSSFLKDLELVFRCGLGSPHDTLGDGTTLLECMIDETALLLLFRDYAKIPCTMDISRQLLKLGVDLNFERMYSRDRLKFWSNNLHEYLLGVDYDLSGSGTETFKSCCSNQQHTAPAAILEFLSCAYQHDIEIPNTPIQTRYDSFYRARPWHNFRTILESLRGKEDLATDMGCGILSTAILRRDKAAVEIMLKHRLELLKTERNVFGHSPIHLAVGWPEGLKALLRVADETALLTPTDDDITFNTPLEYAISFGCPDSVRILAEAGLPFGQEWNLLINTCCLDAGVSKILVGVTMARLEQLLEIARKALPPQTLSNLQIEDLASFDCNAGLVLGYLRKAGVELPRYYHVTPGTPLDEDLWFVIGGIFHQPEITRATAEALFEAGLTKVDGEFSQLTPLLMLPPPTTGHYHFPDKHFDYYRYFGYVEFLVSKGASLERIIPPTFYQCTSEMKGDTASHYRAIHRVAYWSWHKVVMMEPDATDAISSLCSTPTWQNILGSSITDPCTCACSAGGCRPISLALKSAWKSVINATNSLGVSQVDGLKDWAIVCEALNGMAPLFDCLPSDEEVVGAVIRFLTFSALGLTHTCCSHISITSDPFNPDRTNLRLRFKLLTNSLVMMIKLMDPMDAHDIRDEESELTERLDVMVDAFMKDYVDSGTSLSTFLSGRWQETMLEELQRPVPPEIKQQLADIGVRMFDLEDFELDGEGRQFGPARGDSQAFKRAQSMEEEGWQYENWIASLRRRLED
ncbi:hypothetical protein QBC44DRAFT_156483 [Cladorrhinum sp. PSN332]|nr:hypothetical protein QBC44DRAFT_156483 [Cladorrhinum sp. PSN332]